MKMQMLSGFESGFENCTQAARGVNVDPMTVQLMIFLVATAFVCGAFWQQEYDRPHRHWRRTGRYEPKGGWQAFQANGLQLFNKRNAS